MKIIKILETAPDREIITPEQAYIANGVYSTSKNWGITYIVPSEIGVRGVNAQNGGRTVEFTSLREMMTDECTEPAAYFTLDGKRIVLEKEPEDWVLWKDVQDDEFVLAMHKDGDAADVNPKYEYQQPNFTEWNYYLIKS